MATDGKQIKIGNVVYAEQNHSKTCLSSHILPRYKIIVAEGPLSVKPLVLDSAGVLVTDANGNAEFIPVPPGEAGYNKVLATDNTFKLGWISKEDL